jgi:tetratricopeptide (TPR) repeat protein
MGDLGRALERVEQAITRDPSLGDAYWIRGRIRVRTGAVRDALTDLTRALELKPSRYEAYAAMGDAYDQLRRIGDAVRSYEQAVARDPERGEWWYRLGRLRMDSGNEGNASQALGRATALGEAESPRPGWLADAHRIQGDAMRLTGNRAGAVEHYRRYLEIAPPGAIDREEVEQNVEQLTRR